MLRRLFAEALGTGLLIVSVIGTGIMGASFADRNIAVALLANVIATGCMLYAIITVLGSISGAQWVSEVAATFGLLFVIFDGLKARPDDMPTLVAL